MEKFRRQFTLLCFICMLIIGGCSSVEPLNIPPVDSDNRQAQLQQLTSWQVNGKVAFISTEEKFSASLYWQKEKLGQQLKLTNFLGINLLTLVSEDQWHQLEVDGQQYRGSDLNALLTKVSGINLPVAALQAWLKGAAYSSQDIVEYNRDTGLPALLIAKFNGQQWHINYQGYQQVGSLVLPRKLTVTQDLLTIKIQINQWKL
jgi:outer membrane lipoprotein LolB